MVRTTKKKRSSEIQYTLVFSTSGYWTNLDKSTTFVFPRPITYTLTLADLLLFRHFVNGHIGFFDMIFYSPEHILYGIMRHNQVHLLFYAENHSTEVKHRPLARPVTSEAHNPNPFAVKYLTALIINSPLDDLILDD